MMFWKNKKNIFIFTFLAMVFFGVLLAFGLVQAQSSELNFGLQPIEQNIGLGTTDIRLIIARVIRAVLGLLGIIAICIMLWGGYVWMTSAGNEEKVGEAKKIIINGTIGLVIILSAFSITQFIINKLADATGANVESGNPQCKDTVYHQEHICECDGLQACAPFYCEEEMKYQDLFVALSITPNTDDTKMNNVAARAIFNMPISNQFSANGVIKIKKGAEDITNKFDFVFLTDKDNNKIGVEASYKPDSGLCIDGKTACLNNGDYSTAVNENLMSASGKKISIGTEQCPYPMEADFAIKNNKRWVLNFDGVDDVVKASNPLTDGSNTIESWFYPTNKTGGMIVSAGPRLYYLRMTEAGALHFRSSGIPEQNPDKTFNWCDVYSANNVVELNKWHHVIATFDSITKNGYIYLDGKKVGEIPAGKKFAGCEKMAGGNLGVGGLYSGSLKKWTYNFNGQIASVCVYNGVLSEDSVKEHFAAGVGSCGKVGESNLQGGWFLNDWMQKEVLDYSGKNNNGQVLGGAQWLLSPAFGGFSSKDSAPPVLSKLSLNGSTGATQVISGELYTIADTIIDNSGIGYGRVTIERTEGEKKSKEVDYFNGPAVTRQGGSDAPEDNPYLFKYPWVVQKVQDQSVMYEIILDVWDIDHNHSSTSTVFMAVPDHCGNGVQDVDKGETGVDSGGPCGEGGTGSSCVMDSQCSCGKCEKNICVIQPKILDISPMDGAGGNWVTIMGKCFGDETGKVEFGYDSNNDGSITEKDIWSIAKKVDCGTDNTWNDEWVIAEVPTSSLPINTSSSIRITHKKSTPANPLLDYSTDGFGPKPGGSKQGLFYKNEIKRPGLCSVKSNINNQWVNYGYPGVSAEAKGSGFGVKEGSIKFGGTPNPLTYLLQGGLQAQVSFWLDTKIETKVPDNMQKGKVSVYITSDNGQPSNGVPFTVISESDINKNIPVIDKIDPASSTRKSYITISGHGFGNEKGWIYLAGTLLNAQKCADGTLGACQILKVDLPATCGSNTWQDEQVIAEVPSDAIVGTYFLILKNKIGFSSSGEDKFTVKSGDPQPSICKIDPSHGTAPLQSGQFLHLYGANFSSGKGLLTYAYFWTKGANPSSTAGWLDLSSGSDAKLKVFDDGSQVDTIIPITDTGLSMQTGPIKLKANGVVGNSIKYTVEDCQQASVALVAEMKGQKMRCCVAAGPDFGLWKSEGLACAGEPRGAGYVWRFTTGKIRQMPFVIEKCNEVDWNDPAHPPQFPSPVPSTLWKKGKEACLNAEIAVKFNVFMDPLTLSAENIKIFTCADGLLSANCKQQKTLLTGYTIDTNLEKGMYINLKNNADLSSSTWYHVELSNKIQSQVCDINAEPDPNNPLATCIQDPLQVTKPCGVGTAYCFDFKTGTENCTLKDAGIEPAIYTASFLGKILNPAFPYDSKPEHPLYYLLWGRATQECTVLNVDGMGWAWQESTGNTKAIVENSPEKGKYIDSRAEVTALKEAIAPNPVLITAHADELKTDTSSNNTVKQSYTATSTLYIDLYPPKVTMWWPNCSEACINAGIGAKFNRPMYQDSFTKNIKLLQCVDELCENDSNTEVNDWVLDSVLSTDQVIRMKPAKDTSVLASSTWYMVKITGGKDGVYALGHVPLYGEQVKVEDKGKPMAEDFVWKFRTRADDSPCKADKVAVSPDPYIATMIGQKTKYISIPTALTAECGGPQGQELNPWVYGWKWYSYEDVDQVASVTNFKSSSTTNQFCNNSCTLLGSDVSSKAQTPYLCGNGKIEPGEDCDIAAKIVGTLIYEVPGKSCRYNCLRPGNTNFSTSTEKVGFCGNGKPEPEFGEECDPKNPNIKNPEKYCSNKCLWLGSSALLPATDDVATPWCGSGKATLGEECDLKDYTTSTNKSFIGCSENCLHLGTSLAQSWCDDHLDVSQCEKAVSVCGNDEVESGEECEQTEKNKEFCSDYCLLHDICKVNVNDLESTDFYCDKDKVKGCNPDCTLAGSSILYSTPSLCWDGTVGIGEYPGCEATAADLFNVQNPVQLVTAIGLGIVDPLTKSQKTTIEATLDHYFSAKTKNFEALPDAGIVKGQGDYTLKCGYTEYKDPQPVAGGFSYNNCPDTENALTSMGVANNSCCYPRPERSDEYPMDGAGMKAGSEAVCRNTFINVKFANRFIDEKTLSGNLVIAHGYTDPNFNCSLAGEINVNSLVSSTLVLQTTPTETGGFWHNLWKKAKSWLVRILSDELFASDYQAVNDVKVWCSGSITAKPSLYYEWNNDYSAVTTTVALYLDQLLPKETVMAVILLGGSDGIKDTEGMGIRNPDPAVKQLADAWYFKTGDKVCKLTEVTVEPDKWLFSKPLATSTFHAVTHSTNGQQIVPIKGQYYWTWDWQPSGNQIFDIPFKVLDTATTTVVISARKVEGNIMAVANAHVLQDVDQTDNQVGKTFTGATNLTAKFCENPWPKAIYFPFEDGVGFGKKINASGFTASGDFDGSVLPTTNGEYFNFRMSYCADAGQSGTTADDLPYLKPFLALDVDVKVQENLGTCRFSTKNDPVFGGTVMKYATKLGDQGYDPKQCKSDSDCPNIYNMPFGNSPDYPFGLAGVSNNACNSTIPAEDLMAKGCKLYSFDNGTGWCYNNVLNKYPPALAIPEMYTMCKDASGCGMNQICQLQFNSAWKVENKCLGYSTETTSEATKPINLTQDNLRRIIFFSEQNDDIIGLQVFDNPGRLDTGSWIKQKFPNLSGLSMNSVKGYEAMSDGKNYYINFLNEAEYDNKTDLKNKIYLLSVNKDAQESTLNVFNQLVSSLEFNINISDFGYCMVSNPIDQNITKLPFGILQASVTDKTCVDDFECRGSEGLPLAGTNGICSNAKTKLQRDLLRLIDYKAIQTKLDTYINSHANKAPELKSGTYLSGYTVSRWPSWGKLGSEVGGGLPTDKINKWKGCNEKAEQLTCWDTVSSTYYCPNYMQTYEYEYASSTKKYILHAPLEYLATDMSLVDKQVDLDYFTTESWCKPGQSYNMSVGLCGNGVVNKGEQCDPPGKSIVSDEGIVVSTKGKCAEGYKNIQTPKECATDFECGFNIDISNISDKDIAYSDKPSICTFDNEVLFDHTASAGEKLYAFGCTQHTDCFVKSTYSDRAINGVSGYVATSTKEKYEIGDVEFDDYILNHTDKIKCVLPPGGLSKAVTCVGVGTIENKLCPENTKATAICSNSCEWEETSCKANYKCGNGIVEPGEICDDGGLNGTYGHCPVGCHGPVTAFCGDGKINTSTIGGKNLEFCDKAETVYTNGFCKGLPLLTCSDEFKSFCGDVGPCVSQDDPSYDFSKDKTCSWDCQNRAGYCGDGIKQDLEECDDKNNKNYDGCNFWCQLSNAACFESSPKITTSTSYTYIHIIDTKTDTMSQDCLGGTNGTKICNAFGLSCKQVKEQHGSNPQQVLGCQEELSYSPPTILEDKYLEVICNGVYNPPTAPIVEPVKVEEQKCGNQKVETYKDVDGKEIKEACDMGLAKNGIACTPKYGKTCSYCSADCKEILTVNPSGYCGNKVIDVISLDAETKKYKYEICENTDDGIKGPGGGFYPLCPDKGNYTCTEACMKLNDNCVDCRLQVGPNLTYKNPVVPGIRMVNVIDPGSNVLNWPINENDKTNIFLTYQKGGVVSSVSNLFLYPIEGVNHDSDSSLIFDDNGKPLYIEGDTMCNAPNGNYSVGFTDDLVSITDTPLNEKEIFDFPISSVLEEENLINEYVISPVMLEGPNKTSVKQNMIRIVARWTGDEDKVAQFKVMLQNDSINNGKAIDYATAKKKNLLSDSGYFPSIPKYNGLEIYVHEIGGSDKNKVQAVTMDHTSYTGTTTVFVEAIGVPIAYFKNSNLQLEVYLSEAGQNPLKIYQPDYVFNISKAAGTSSNDDAVEWWVFDFKRETNVWKIVPVEQIKTSWCYIINPNNPLVCK